MADAESINELLRDRPRLVERFLAFNGWHRSAAGAYPAALPAARCHRGPPVTPSEMRSLYEAAFAAVASLRPHRQRATRPVRPGHLIQQDDSGSRDANAKLTGELGGAFGPETHRRGGYWVRGTSAAHPSATGGASVDSVLARAPRGPSGVSGAEPADQWLAAGSRNLVVGDPGTGKSSLLRFVASDLLADVPESVRFSAPTAIACPCGCHSVSFASTSKTIRPTPSPLRQKPG